MKNKIDGSRRTKNFIRAKYYQNIRSTKIEALKKFKKQETFFKFEIDKLICKLTRSEREHQKSRNYIDTFDTNKNLRNFLENKLKKLYDELSKNQEERKLFNEHKEKLGFKEQDQYIKFLLNLRLLARSLKSGLDAYEPVIVLLNGIKSIIEGPINLVESDEDTDVILATILLSKHANYLHETSWSLRESITSNHKKRSWLLNWNNQKF